MQLYSYFYQYVRSDKTAWSSRVHCDTVSGRNSRYLRCFYSITAVLLTYLFQHFQVDNMRQSLNEVDTNKASLSSEVDETRATLAVSLKACACTVGYSCLQPEQATVDCGLYSCQFLTCSMLATGFRRFAMLYRSYSFAFCHVCKCSFITRPGYNSWALLSNIETLLILKLGSILFG